MTDKEPMIAAARAFCESVNAFPPNGIYELMSAFAIEQLAANRIQFNEAIPAMKEAYQQGKQDAKAEGNGLFNELKPDCQCGNPAAMHFFDIATQTRTYCIIGDCKMYSPEAANRPEPAALIKAKEVATEISRWRVGSMGESGVVYTGSIKAETITELLFLLNEVDKEATNG
jgi:hypothetical protein